MFLSIEPTAIAITPETDRERQCLYQDKVYTKLCCEIMPKRVEPKTDWHIDYRWNEFTVNSKTKEIVLPEGLSDEQLLYALRIVVDGISLQQDYIPLHAAAVSNGKRILLIFGDSGAGKSQFAHYLCGTDGGFFMIGDDHIILSDGFVLGNSMSRHRTDCDEFFTEAVGIEHTLPLVAMCIKVDTERCSLKPVSNKKRFKQLRKHTALKYLLNDFVVEVQGQELCYYVDDIFDCDMQALCKDTVSLIAEEFYPFAKLKAPRSETPEVIQEYAAYYMGD